MDSNEVEETVLYHKALGDPAFITNHFADTFGNVRASDFGYIAFIIVLDEADEPHLPHADESLVHIDKAVLAHVLFQFIQPLMLELLLTFLNADRDKIVLLYVLEYHLRSIFEYCVALLAHIPCHGKHFEVFKHVLPLIVLYQLMIRDHHIY